MVNFYHKIIDYYHQFFYTDTSFVKKQFKKELDRRLDLSKPVTFDEKLQWLKLNWRDPLGTLCVDKYTVRTYVAEKADKKYLNELLGIYEHVSEIDLNTLPNKFVLKGTHGSGYNIICHNKDKPNWKNEFKKMDGWLHRNYYWQSREWFYKEVKPRIICEAFLTNDIGSRDLIDYKFYCFNGVPKYCQVIKDRSDNETIDFYDINWNLTSCRRLTKSKQYPNSSGIDKPLNYEEMLELVVKLSGTFPFVRVDLYNIDGRIIFGELTFYPLSGLGKFYPEEWNKVLGDLLVLPRK